MSKMQARTGGKLYILRSAVFAHLHFDHSPRDTAESSVQPIITNHLKYGTGFELEGHFTLFWEEP
jgi:hypothetical protein